MNIGYKTHFPWGAKTDFEMKIISSRTLLGMNESDRRLAMAHIEAPGSTYYYPKIHTIRQDAGDRWHRRRGQFMKIHHAVGVRTKNYRCFWVSECTGIQDIEIEWVTVARQEGPIKEAKVYIDSIEIEGKTIELLAKNDGFNNVTDFFRWFSKDFAGKIIHWTDFRYQVDESRLQEAYKVNLPKFSENDLKTIQSLNP